MSTVTSTYNPGHSCPVLAKMQGMRGFVPPIQEFVLGKDDYGCDVKAFGATSGSYLLWDESADTLKLVQAGIQIGTLSSTTQTGFALTSTNNNVIDSFADDNNTTLTNAVYSNFRARTMLFKDATGISLFSVRGQIKCADEVDFGPGVFAGVQGYFETMDDTDIQSGAKVWGVDACLESPSGGTVTVDSGGILGGLHAELTGAGEFVQSSGGILAGLYIDEQVTTGKWGYGIYMTAGSANKAIRVGSLSSTVAGSGMLIDATHTRAVEIHVDDNDTARATGTQGRAIFGRTMIYANNACEDWGVDGLSKVSGVAKTGNVSAGVVGRFESTGTCSTATGSGNTWCAGVMGRLGGGGTFTIGSGTQVAGVLAFYNTSTTNAFTNTGTCAFLAVASEIAGTGDWDYGIYVQDAVRAGYFTTAPVGAAAINNFDLVVADACTQSSGYAHALHIGLTNSGNKTGAASVSQMNGIGVDYTQSGTFTGGINGIYVYIDDSGGPTLTSAQVAGGYFDLQEMGQTTTMACLALDKSNTTVGSYVDCFIHMVNQGSGVTTNALAFHGANATNFLQVAQVNGFASVDTGNTGAASTHKIKVMMGATAGYIAVFADY